MRAAIAIALLAACSGKPSPAPAATSAPSCFDVAVEDNTPGTQAVFDEHHCQGGGVTWGALLRVLVARHAEIAPGTIHIDEEGDAAQLCAPASTARTLHADYQRLNHDPVDLARAMAASSTRELECDGDD